MLKRRIRCRRVQTQKHWQYVALTDAQEQQAARLPPTQHVPQRAPREGGSVSGVSVREWLVEGGREVLFFVPSSIGSCCFLLLVACLLGVSLVSRV